MSIKYNCPRCLAERFQDSVKCLSCGLDLTKPYWGAIYKNTIKGFCPQCNFELPKDSEKCTSCGTIFKDYNAKKRIEEKDKKACPRCTSREYTGSLKCYQCGLDLTKEYLGPIQRVVIRCHCPQCDIEVSTESKVCYSCGYDMENGEHKSKDSEMQVDEGIEAIFEDPVRIDAIKEVKGNSQDEFLRIDVIKEAKDNLFEEPVNLESIDGYKVCPFCAETIKKAAIVCRYCKRDLPHISNEEDTLKSDSYGKKNEENPENNNVNIESKSQNIFGSSHSGQKSRMPPTPNLKSSTIATKFAQISLVFGIIAVTSYVVYSFTGYLIFGILYMLAPIMGIFFALISFKNGEKKEKKAVSGLLLSLAVFIVMFFVLIIKIYSY